MTDSSGIERRRFLAACGAAGTAAAGAALAAAGQQAGSGDQAQPAPVRRNYTISIEIVECRRGKCAQHQVGQTFSYPADRGQLCPWLLDSMNGAIRVLEYGGTLPWRYAGTPYEKVIDPDGITTEFIRCPDPTESGVVAKITRAVRS